MQVDKNVVVKMGLLGTTGLRIGAGKRGKGKGGKGKGPTGKGKGKGKGRAPWQ